MKALDELSLIELLNKLGALSAEVWSLGIGLSVEYAVNHREETFVVSLTDDEGQTVYFGDFFSDYLGVPGHSVLLSNNNVIASIEWIHQAVAEHSSNEGSDECAYEACVECPDYTCSVAVDYNEFSNFLESEIKSPADEKVTLINLENSVEDKS